VMLRHERAALRRAKLARSAPPPEPASVQGMGWKLALFLAWRQLVKRLTGEA